MTSKQAHGLGTLSWKRRLLTASPSYLPLPLKLALGLADRYIYAMAPVAAVSYLFHPVGLDRPLISNSTVLAPG